MSHESLGGGIGEEIRDLVQDLKGDIKVILDKFLEGHLEHLDLGVANNENSSHENINDASGNDSLVGGNSKSDGDHHDIIVQNNDDDTLPHADNEASESAGNEDSVTLVGVPVSDITNNLTPFDLS